MRGEIGCLRCLVRLRIVLFQGIYLSAEEVAMRSYILLGMVEKFHWGFGRDGCPIGNSWYRRLGVINNRYSSVAHSALCWANANNKWRYDYSKHATRGC